MSASVKWSDLPANAQVDAALRRAAAGVCGFACDEDRQVFIEPDGYELLFEPGYPEENDAWSPDTDRNQLARVFVATWQQITTEKEICTLDQRWAQALHDPRAALVALLDLLEIAPPEGLE